MQKKKYLENWSNPYKQTWSPAFPEGFKLSFLRNSIKEVVLRAVLGPILGALLRAETNQSAFSDDSCKWR